MRALFVLVAVLLGESEAWSQPALEERVWPKLIRQYLEQYLERRDLPKYALTVGIQDYTNLPRVNNALNDVRLMYQTLTDLGFNVDSLTNATREQLLDRLDEFSERLVSSEPVVKSVVAFYFAGHGFNKGNGNMILPADAATAGNRLFLDSIPLDHVVEKLSGKDVAVAIVFLDACRNELVIDSRGSIGHFQQPPTDQQTKVFYGFASGFGMPSLSFAAPQDPNSPFALALSTSLANEKYELRNVFMKVRHVVSQHTNRRQIPQDLPTLLGEYYFHPADDDTNEHWLGELATKLIRGGVCQYVTQYPAGPYSTGARAWLQDNPGFIGPNCPM